MFQADVIAIWETLFQKSFLVVTGWCYCLLFWFHWLMFWPMICGRCYATRADVIAHLCSICSMADVIAICCGRCCCHLFFFYYIEYGWCYCHMCVADVMPPGLMFLPIYVLFVIWLVLLPLIVADVVATCFDYIEYGWCYCHMCVADVIATRLMLLPTIFVFWLMLLP